MPQPGHPSGAEGLSRVIDLDDVHRAAARIAPTAHRTPVVTSTSIDDRVGASVLCKFESLQRTGSFKLRGASNALLAQAGEAVERGVVTWSSGNHAQAVALAGRLLGAEVTVLMPDDAPTVKIAATRGYGATIVTYDRHREDRARRAEDLVNRTGALAVPPFDDDLVMAGQGTAALELFEECGGLDVLVVPVGGGGLAAGCATVAKALDAGVTVVGVEPSERRVTHDSIVAGARQTVEVPRTIADGLQTTSPGARTFEVNRRRLDLLVAVTDEQVVDAMRLVFERLRMVVEPSGAVALAAVLSGSVDVRGARVGVLVSGGNVDVSRFAALLVDGPPADSTAGGPEAGQPASMPRST